MARNILHWKRLLSEENVLKICHFHIISLKYFRLDRRSREGFDMIMSPLQEIDPPGRRGRKGL